MYGRMKNVATSFGRHQRPRGSSSGRWGFSRHDEMRQDDEASFSSRSEHRQSEKHPPGLRGRAIGMWYARHSRGKPRAETRQCIQMNESKTKEIENLLDQLHDGRPSSHRNTREDGSESAFKFSYMKHKLESEQIEKGDVEPTNACAIERNSVLDGRLRDEYLAKSRSLSDMQKFRHALPAYSKREELLRAVNDSQVVVISGETGCGKTTQVPQFILDEYIKAGRGSSCYLVCTQPRRISAITVAERVAEERDEPCGLNGSVGYQIRLESKMPRSHGAIIYCTTGTVLKYLTTDPCLSRATHLIIDEIHERDLQSDFLLIVMKDLLRVRPDLKLILMSATLNSQKFSSFYGNCPIVHIPGFTYPVKEYYLEDVFELTNYKVPLARKERNWKRNLDALEDHPDNETFLMSLENRYSRQTINSLRNWDENGPETNCIVHHLLKHLCQNEPEGAILVFLTGWDTISSVNKLLTQDPYFSTGQHRILPLHSLMPTVNQREVFCRPPKGTRKIILSTNIAETSITIDDIVYVVDCGHIKMTNYSTEHNISTLAPEWISLANAHQRRGRAGRVQPGICYHLYTKLRESTLQAYQLPEMLRTRLESLCLQIKLLKFGKVEPFLRKAMDPPSSESLQQSLKMLTRMNALDSDENLTPLGYHLAKLPVDPQTGKMLLFGAIFSCLNPILTVAASLGFKDAFVKPLGKEAQVDRCKWAISDGSKSDHIALVNAFDAWERAAQHYREREYCFHNFLSDSTLKMLKKMKEQLAQHLYDVKLIGSPCPKDPASNRNSDNLKLIKAVICAGLYPNVAKLKKKQRAGASRKTRGQNAALTQEDGSVKLHLNSVNALEGYFESPWLVYHLKIKSMGGINVHDCTMVPAYPLIFFGGRIAFDEDHGSENITVDNFMKFHCTRKTADLILKLRRQLDQLLDHKISHTGCTDWNPATQEGALLNAIVELISSEEIQTQTFYENRLQRNSTQDADSDAE